MKIRRGDSVVVIAGNDKGSTPHKVAQILDNGRKVVVEGINVVKKHVRRGHPKSPQGGRLDMEKPIDVSNIAYYCAACNAPTRLGIRYTSDGQKERFCRKCDAGAGTIGAPKASRAT